VGARRDWWVSPSAGILRESHVSTESVRKPVDDSPAIAFNQLNGNESLLLQDGERIRDGQTLPTCPCRRARFNGTDVLAALDSSAVTT
jgi:hypothetical protein